MPLDEIRTVMSTTDIRRRNEMINAQQRIDRRTCSEPPGRHMNSAPRKSRPRFGRPEGRQSNMKCDDCPNAVQV
jgi:hypothetical protein